MSDDLVIAIDGPAASGKGTLARRLAAHYGLPHLDTGLLYRATAYALRRAGIPLDDVAAAERVAASLDPALFDDPALRDAETGEGASVVAAIDAVRRALVERQRAFARQPGGAVLDGRDVGTVICPWAPVKVFVTAAPEIRAMRRHAELAARGAVVSFEDVLADIERRDRRDRERVSAPLAAAPDSCLLETSDLDIETAFSTARQLIDCVVEARGLNRPVVAPV